MLSNVILDVLAATKRHVLSFRSESSGAYPPLPGKSESEKEKCSKFDVDKELNAIPALDLDLFQQKILNNRLAAKAAAAPGNPPVVMKRSMGPQGEGGSGPHQGPML